MSDYFTKKDALPADATAIPVHICRPDAADALYARLSDAQSNYAKAHKFSGEAGQAVLLPSESGDIAAVLFGAGKQEDGYNTSPVAVGSLSAKLASGYYTVASKPDDWTDALVAIFWGMGAYKFTKYLQDDFSAPTLVLQDASTADESIALVRALHNGRDLINTPASDMGPVALHDAAQAMANKYDAKLQAVVGEDLLTENYPMIHAVGRAAHEPPRLVEINWGPKDAPKLTLVGKGITFDTGGVNIKGAAGMRIMKKDMGGAAHALALAEMIMATGQPIRLQVLLAVAENAISASAFRPGDVLPSRQGLTVEIDNTDAEGRLVLGDALTKAAEENPDLIIDFATLTGAARVALGPTLPPFFSNRDEPVQALLSSGIEQSDPFWQMPLWQPYMSLLNSPISDLKNAGGGFAGAVTAALFLQKFVDDTPWMHFDVYGWNPTSSPSRPKGGEIMTVRAIYHWLKQGGLKRRG
jgi:leucyl aminopeptidase